ncbi:DUF397 domain-containing protein [Streptomyces sp. NPDC058664]|uniref:DUF397 domain-containing protein n=1 Tax=unclassified Streptomyces TaxID=2593676 RepID=UPI0036601B8D
MKSVTSKTSPHLHWNKSSYSNGSGGECLECAQTETKIFIRDSKSIQGPAISMHPAPWQTFVDSLSAQE